MGAAIFASSKRGVLQMMCMVSVIIPGYNHASFLKQRIDSVLHQTYQDFELIILDDCSTDNSKEIIEFYRSHPKVSHLVFNEQNSGSAFKQWKKGVDLAKGEWVWIAESDDWADINFLSILTGMIHQKDVSLAYCRTNIVFENQPENLYKWGEAIEPAIWASDHIFDGKKFINSFMRYRNVIPNASAVIFRKQNFTGIDMILKMRYAGDWLLWIIIAAKGKVAYCHDALNYFRRHDNTTRPMKSFKEEIRRIEEYFLSIQEACRITESRFEAFDKKYKWIIDQWMDRIKVFGLKRSMRPPYPFLFLLRLYYRLLIIKFK